MRFRRKRENDPDLLEAETPNGLFKVEARRRGRLWQIVVRVGDKTYSPARLVLRRSLERAAGEFLVSVMADVHCMLSQDRAYVADLIQQANHAEVK